MEVPKRIISFDPVYEGSVIAASAIVLFFIRFYLQKRIFNPMAERRKLSKKQIARFSEHAWFSVYYTVFTSISLFILAKKSWLWNTPDVIQGFPHLEPEVDLRTYYMIECGFYIQALFGLLFIDERQKDFGLMIVHHVVTISLVLFSMVSLFHRIGSLVFLLHNIVDIFLFTAKAIFELGYKTLANYMFFVFTLTFFLCRLVYFPYVISQAAFNTPPHTYGFPAHSYYFGYVEDAITPFEVSSYGVCINKYCVSSYWLQTYLMVALLCMHIYWFYLILVLLVKTVRNSGEVPGDLRNEDFEETKPVRIADGQDFPPQQLTEEKRTVEKRKMA